MQFLWKMFYICKGIIDLCKLNIIVNSVVWISPKNVLYYEFNGYYYETSVYLVNKSVDNVHNLVEIMMQIQLLSTFAYDEIRCKSCGMQKCMKFVFSR